MTTPFPHSLAWMIDNPVRALLLSPRKLVGRLPIRAHDWILEVGPGSGFFSVELAKRVPGGHLELLDIQPEMLDKSRRKLTAAGMKNVGFTVADAGLRLPLPESRFDLALLVTVLGETHDPVAALEGISVVLRAGGTLVIHEQLPDPDMISLRRLQPLVESCGFTMLATHGPRWNYTALFRRNGDTPTPDRAQE
jgi:ubiquinone/menaquinone biosynthesis C-methylase UbiE